MSFGISLILLKNIMPKPTFDKKRALSWSAISSFEYDPEQWYQSYVLGIRSSSKEMEFGSMIDRKIQDDIDFLPHLPRYERMQHKMKYVLSGIPLVGILDGMNTDPLELCDFKTGKKAWDQKRADDTGQITMYLLLLYATERINPEDVRCFIHWLPTVENGDFSISLIDENKFYTFETKRTMKQLLEFGKKIKKIYKDMQEYALAHE